MKSIPPSSSATRATTATAFATTWRSEASNPSSRRDRTVRRQSNTIGKPTSGATSSSGASIASSNAGASPPDTRKPPELTFRCYASQQRNYADKRRCGIVIGWLRTASHYCVAPIPGKFVLAPHLGVVASQTWGPASSGPHFPCESQSLRTLPIRSFASMSSARQALIPFYDFNLCLDRIRDIARLVGPVMKLMHVRRRRPAVAAEHNARSQRHIRHPFSTVIALRHDPYGFVSIRFYFETFPRAERQKNSMWRQTGALLPSHLLVSSWWPRSGSFRRCDPILGVVPERLKVADQDRGVHKSDEMRARASGEGDRLGELQGHVGGWGSGRHGKGIAGW